jgi:hypothetical protein
MSASSPCASARSPCASASKRRLDSMVFFLRLDSSTDRHAISQTEKQTDAASSCVYKNEYTYAHLRPYSCFVKGLPCVRGLTLACGQKKSHVSQCRWTQLKRASGIRAAAH